MGTSLRRGVKETFIAGSVLTLCTCLVVYGTRILSATPLRPVVEFSDLTIGSGVGFLADGSPTTKKYLVETMTGGVALLDFDGDGRLDIFFANGAALADPMLSTDQPKKTDRRFWNRLYRNLGGAKFRDVTSDAGVEGHSFGMGVAVGDYDNDGRPDLYVTNFGANILYHNGGNGKFSDVTAPAGVAGGGWSSGAAFFDFDNDGDLDLFVARYLQWDFTDVWCGEKRQGYRSYCHPDHFRPVSHILFANNGNGTFTDVSERAGIAGKPGKGLGVAIQDFDRDGLIDVVVANDSFPQQLFRNTGNGAFDEVGLAAGIAYDDNGRGFAGMGVAWADYNRDGWPDLFVNALANQRYALFRNDRGSFQYVSGSSGIGQISLLHSGWGTGFLDYDNDGWRDLFVAQSHVLDNVQLTQPSVKYLEPLLLMRNQNGRFRDVSSQVGQVFRVPRSARGAAFGDLDNDGFTDAVVSCLGQNAIVLRNTGGNGNHWLTLRTAGTVSNRDGIGAKIRLVSASTGEQFGFVAPSGSYLSSNDMRIHFGLGADSEVKLLEITWPSGIVQTLRNVKSNQILTVSER